MTSETEGKEKATKVKPKCDRYGRGPWTDDCAFCPVEPACTKEAKVKPKTVRCKLSRSERPCSLVRATGHVCFTCEFQEADE